MHHRFLLATLLCLFVSTPAFARDNLEDLLRDGIRIILGGPKGQQSSDGSGSTRDRRDAFEQPSDYYIDYRIKRRLTDADKARVADATRQALNSGEPQRLRNRRAGFTLLITVSDAHGYANFDDTTRYDRDRQGEGRYSTYPDGRYRRGESAWPDDDPDPSASVPRHVPSLAHVDDWFQVNEPTPVRAGPGPRFDRISTLNSDDYVHVVGVVNRTLNSNDSERRRGVWAFVDDGGVGTGFVNARRLATYREGQVDLIELAGGSRDDYRSASSSTLPTRQRCRSLTQRLVTSREDNAYTQVFCLNENDAWEVAR